MRIEIISTPSGQAPLEVRKNWVGCQFIARKNLAKGIQMGIFGGQIDRQNLNGYEVDTDHAIEVLEQKNPESAQWWKNWQDSLTLVPGYLVFGKEFCKVIE